MSRTGRIMAPFPARGGVTGRQMRADDRRIHAWLISEALAEIAVEPVYAHLAAMVRRLDPGGMIGSDRDTLCLILFDDPDGPGPINRIALPEADAEQAGPSSSPQSSGSKGRRGG